MAWYSGVFMFVSVDSLCVCDCVLRAVCIILSLCALQASTLIVRLDLPLQHPKRVTRVPSMHFTVGTAGLFVCVQHFLQLEQLTEIAQNLPPVR